MSSEAEAPHWIRVSDEGADYLMEKAKRDMLGFDPASAEAQEPSAEGANLDS